MMCVELQPCDRKSAYMNYISNHIANVMRSWNEVLKPFILTETDLTVEEITEIEKNLSHHDESKYCDEEFDPYAVYFYNEDGSDRDSKTITEEEDIAFDRSWLHHQNVNPHHWQYWILMRDSGKTIPQDMDIKYICEMLCDWHSFSAKDPTSTAYDWYQSNKNKIIFSDTTSKLVDKYIKAFKDNPLG